MVSCVRTMNMLSQERGLFARSFETYFLEKVFVIDKISRQFSLPIYYLKGEKDGKPLLAPFYGNELVAIADDETDNE